MFNHGVYKKTHLVGDLFLLLCLFILSAQVAHDFLLKAPTGVFYQQYFAPAVMQACGKGYSNVRFEDQSNKLKQFLARDVQSFDCSDLSGTIKVSELTNFQIAEHYLLSSTALLWKLTSISWENLWYLNIFLFCLTIGGAYSIFRLGMHPILAFILSLCLIYSPLHLSFLPDLRDYSVAPFALWLTWLLGLLVSRNNTFKKSILLVTITGLILGVSFGFRSDLLICLPAVLVTILFFMGNRQLKIKEKGILSLIFLGVFFLAVNPIFFPLLNSGSNLAHVTILGLFEPFSTALGLHPPPLTVYSMGGVYRDEYVYLLLNDYNQRVFHQSPVFVGSKPYDHVGMLFLLDWVKNFPADFLIRIASSINKIAFSPLGYFNQTTYLNYYINSILFLAMPLITLVVLACINLRISLFVLFCIVFFAGYPAIQFSERHYFYLEFIGLWCLGFTTQMIWMYLKKPKMCNRVIFHNSYKIPKAILSLVCIVLISLLTLQTARWYQSKHLKELFTTYLNVKTIDIATVDSVQDDKTLIKLVEQENLPKNKYFKITFSPLCPKKVLRFNLNFNAQSPISTRDFLVDNYKNATLFYPVYDSPALFEGIQVASEDRACIKNISVVQADKNIRLWPVLWLSDKSWETKKLFQHFVNTTVYTFNISHFPEIDFHVSDNEKAEAVSVSKLYNAKKNIIKGFVPIQNKGSYLAWIPVKTSPKVKVNNLIFYAEGIIKQGGFNIGLVDKKTHLWTKQITINAGKFRLYLNPSNEDETNILLTSSKAGTNDITIKKMGWITLENPQVPI